MGMVLAVMDVFTRYEEIGDFCELVDM